MTLTRIKLFELLLSELINTYFMKQADLYHFETIKITSQA